MPIDPTDSYWMAQALKEAQRGLGSTSPNPAVGAVIVANGQLLAAAHHPKAGMWHAERRAIHQVLNQGQGSALQGATIYITLEPCSSWGKTPPCTQAIIDAGITRVVYACQDPDKRHRGRADALLRAQGIEVLSGIYEAPCAAFLRPWAYAITHHRPWIVAKIASSLDARLSRQSTPWLSSKESLSYAHQLRAESDGILVGGGTVRSDDPSLTIRTPQQAPSEYKEQPWRIILSRDEQKLRQEARAAQLFNDEYKDRTLIFEQIENWEEQLLRPLHQQYGITQLMVESGGKLLQQMLEQQLINEWVQIITPHLAGGPHQLIPQSSYLAQEAQLQETRLEQQGQDIILRGLLNYTPSHDQKTNSPHRP